MIAEELKKEIKSHYDTKLSNLTVRLEKSTSSIMKQLSFAFSSIFELNKNRKRKFTTEFLEKDNDDYKFILDSFNNENVLKIRQLYRINSTDKNEVAKINHKYLYLNVVHRDQVKGVLTSDNSYSKFNDDIDINCRKSYVASTSLYKVLTNKRCSYFQVDNTVKKLSFVFLSAFTGESYQELNFKECKVIRDCRASLAAEDCLCNKDNKTYDIVDFVPVYLVVFEYK